jgi:hypothetical protein
MGVTAVASRIQNAARKDWDTQLSIIKIRRRYRVLLSRLSAYDAGLNVSTLAVTSTTSPIASTATVTESATAVGTPSPEPRSHGLSKSGKTGVGVGVTLWVLGCWLLLRWFGGSGRRDKERQRRTIEEWWRRTIPLRDMRLQTIQ